jgi:hypothetical protein
MVGGGACSIETLNVDNRLCPCFLPYTCVANRCVLPSGESTLDSGSESGHEQGDARESGDEQPEASGDEQHDAGGDEQGDAPIDRASPPPSDGPSDAPMRPEQDASCAANLMIDPDNCGSCGHSCLGGGCNAGACMPITLASGTNVVGSIGLAVDATYVYWTNQNGANSAINKVGITGGTPSPVVSGTAYSNLQDVATDNKGFVYWTLKGAGGSVQRAVPSGMSLATIASNQGNPDWIASNGTTVFWTNQATNQVVSAPADAATVTPTQLNNSNENGTVPAGVAIDSVNVYYATKTAGGGLAEYVPLAGGSVTELGSGSYSTIAVDDDNVYWTGGFASHVVYQNSKTGTPSSVSIIASGGTLSCPLHLASDGTNVYFFDQGTDSSGNVKVGTGALYRVPIGNTGPLPPPLVSGLTNPQGMAIDPKAVYWVNSTVNVPADAGIMTGSVMKLAK